MSRPFYLIGHNPNSMEAVEACLANGGNAIEPDVYYEDGTYYMMELVPVISSIFPPKKGPTIEVFLSDVDQLLLDHPAYNLALIIFDTKNINDYDINALADKIRTNFLDFHPGVRIAITTGTPKYVSSFHPFQAKSSLEYVGIDASYKAMDSFQFFTKEKLNHIYGNGTSLPFIPSNASIYKDQIKKAVQIRDHAANHFLQLVYAYCVNAKTSMRRYLDENVDGLITDKVIELYEVLKEDAYKDKYILATPESNDVDNPII